MGQSSSECPHPCDEDVGVGDSDETHSESPFGPKPSLRTLRGAFADVLPDLTYQDFLDIKSIWEPRMPPDE